MLNIFFLACLDGATLPATIPVFFFAAADCIAQFFSIDSSDVCGFRGQRILALIRPSVSMVFVPAMAVLLLASA